MKDAAQYPITFAYGATDGYYYGPNGIIGPYHRGDDRAMPDGTPVIVNGVEIGLSNNTGASSGSHLHIGRFVNGKDTNPNGAGFEFDDAVVTEINQDSVNGKYVRIQADGASWIYLHLMDNNKAAVGQRLVKVEDVPTLADHDMVDRLAHAFLNDSLDKNPDLSFYIGQPIDVVINTFNESPERAAYLKHLQDLENGVPPIPAPVITPSNPQPSTDNQFKPLPHLDPMPITLPPVEPLPPKRTLADILKAFWKVLLG